MKKLVILAGASLLLAACGDSSSSSDSSSLGNTVLSASAVLIDEAQKTIDITLPSCQYINGEAVFTETASGPSPYTISNGILNIDNSFIAKGNNQSIIGVWDFDIGDNDDNDGTSFESMGIKMYLDIGQNNFDIVANSDNACIAQIFAATSFNDEDMIIKSQSCDKVVIASREMPGMEMTVTSNVDFPKVTMEVSVLDFSCKMAMTIGQPTRSNCTVENLRNGSFDESGMFYSSIDFSEDCLVLEMNNSSPFAVKAKQVFSKVR